MQQQFVIEKLPDGYFKIWNKVSGKVLDVSNASTAAGANVQQIAISTDGVNDAQRWYFESDGDGYYYICSKLGTTVGVRNGTASAGQNVQTCTKVSSKAQKFQLRLVPPTISVNKTNAMVNDEVTVSWEHAYGAGVYGYYLAEFPQAFAYETYTRSERVYGTQLTFADLPAGSYSLFLHAYNDYADGDQSNWVNFNIYEKDYIPVMRKNYNGHVYAVYDNAASWSFCKELCEDMGGHLATINSAGEDSFLSELIQSGAKSAYWIGGTNWDSAASNQDGTWSWVTGEPFTYTNWAAGQPSASGKNGTREHWARLVKSSKKWDDTYNTNKAGFVIEIEPNSADITARERYNGHEYLLVDKKSTWSEAQGYCLAMGGQLCAINDANEAKFIDSFIQRGTRKWYYVGGVRRNGVWYWLDGSTEGAKIQSIEWEGSLWPSYYNYLMKYKSDNKYINLPNTYFPSKHIYNIGFICEINNPQPESYAVSFSANGGRLELTKAKTVYDVTNGARGNNQLVVFNGNYGTSTRTDEYGTEVLISPECRVTEIITGVGNATIPTGGYVLSGHGTAHRWLLDNIEVGDYINLHPEYDDPVWVWTKNGWLSATKKVTYDGTYGELPVPLERTGYTFTGWYTAASGGTKVTTSTKVTATSNHTLYAQWKANSYTVSFSANGGSGSMASQTVTGGGSLTLPACGFTAPDGKRFKAWRIGGEEYAVGASYTVSGNTIVYAVWEDIPCGVTGRVSGSTIA